MADEDVVIVGADALVAISRQLKDIGDTTLRRDLLAGIQRATKPLKQKAVDSAQAKLPHGGGLNEFVAGGRITTTTSTGRNRYGVRIKPRRGAGADRGFIRHPVFGDREVWVDQPTPPGWFTDAMEDGAEDVRDEVLDVLEDVARRLADG